MVYFRHCGCTSFLFCFQIIQASNERREGVQIFPYIDMLPLPTIPCLLDIFGVATIYTVLVHIYIYTRSVSLFIPSLSGLVHYYSLSLSLRSIWLPYNCRPIMIICCGGENWQCDADPSLQSWRVFLSRSGRCGGSGGGDGSCFLLW